MTAISLRPYQEKALDDVEQAEREGVRRPLVVHPTGTGKGVVMGALPGRRKDRGRSIVLVHREELADQFIEKLNWQFPELSVGVVKAERDEVDADVVVASVPTAQSDKRLARLVESARRSPFGTIIADEAHLAPAPSWTKVLTGLGSFHPYGPLTVGFTATPEREGKSLAVWERVVSYMSIREAIFSGYLVPILPAMVIETKMDLAKVRKTGGDYSKGDLGQEMEDSGAIEEIADGLIENAADRKILAFTPTVATAHALAAALVRRGMTAESVDGETESDLRTGVKARLKTGETQCVVNCGVFTTGFDEPSIDCVAIARPTSSHTLYVQMAGRGTRLSPGKANLLIIDFVGATKRHELITRVDLGDEPETKRKKKDGEGERQTCPTCDSSDCEVTWHRCSLCRRYLPARVVSENGHRHENCDAGKASKVDVFGTSRLRWLPVGPAWVLSAGDDVVVMVPAGADTWRLANYSGGRIKILHDELPGDWARGIGEDRAKAFQRLVERDTNWLRRSVTDPQKSRLLREGLPERALPKVKTRGDAADLITRIQGRRAVKKLGVSI